MEPSGYSAFFLFGVLLIGLCLIVIRPYWAFLFTMVLFGALNTYAAVSTRSQLLGPYFNFYDALFIIAFLSIIFDSDGSPLIIPRPLEWILLTIIIGILQILWYYHVNYVVLRNLRWAITFPLAFFIGANAVCKPDRVKSFLYAIIIGCVLNAIVSFVDYKGLAMLRPQDPMIRLAEAGNYLGVSLLVAATQRSFFPGAGLAVHLIWGAALLFLALTILFGLWRSVFLGALISMICLPIILRRWESFARSIILVLVGAPLLMITLQISLPTISASRMVQRLALVTNYLDWKKNIPREDVGRWRQIERDFEEWSKGNWLIGRGLGFMAFLPDATGSNIAWGHVGYTSYLSQFGLFGLIIFAIYLPLQMLKAGQEVYFSSRDGPKSNLGLLALAAVVFVSVICSMSASYLSPTMHSIGFLYGAIWSLAYRNAAAATETGQVLPG